MGLAMCGLVPTPGAPTPRPLLLRPLGHTSELEAGGALAGGRCSIHNASRLPFHTRTADEHFLLPKAGTLTFSRLSLPSPSHLHEVHVASLYSTLHHCTPLLTLEVITALFCAQLRHGT